MKKSITWKLKGCELEETESSEMLDISWLKKCSGSVSQAIWSCGIFSSELTLYKRDFRSRCFRQFSSWGLTSRGSCGMGFSDEKKNGCVEKKHKKLQSRIDTRIFSSIKMYLYLIHFWKIHKILLFIFIFPYIWHFQAQLLSRDLFVKIHSDFCDPKTKEKKCFFLKIEIQGTFFSSPNDSFTFFRDTFSKRLRKYENDAKPRTLWYRQLLFLRKNPSLDSNSKPKIPTFDNFPPQLSI